MSRNIDLSLWGREIVDLDMNTSSAAFSSIWRALTLTGGGYTL